MPVPHRFFTRLITAAALSSGLCACDTSQVQLEPLRAELANDGGDIEDRADGGDTAHGSDSDDAAEEVACLGILVGFGTEGTPYDVLVNGHPLMVDGLAEPTILYVPAGGTGGFCVAPGSYDVALSYQGEIVVPIGKLSLADGEQLMVIAYGTAQQPIVKVSEVDLTPPGKGLRRMRITNVVPDQQPLQLIYYDAQNREISRSRVVAYGATDISMIPAEASFWRVEPDEARWPIVAGNIDSETRCAEAQATGIILLARDPEQTWSRIPFEYYAQPTRNCEPDPELESDGGASRKPMEPYPIPVEP